MENNKELILKKIIKEEIASDNWLEHELLKPNQRMTQRANKSLNSPFEVHYFGLELQSPETLIAYLKNQSLVFIVNVLYGLALRDIGWQKNLAEFIIDKISSEIKEKFDSAESEEKWFVQIKLGVKLSWTELYKNLQQEQK